jgi:ketosteroid isomerase-like protein
MAGVVRTPIGPDARLPTRRTLDERLIVRWPWVYAALTRAVLLLPPRALLRRALLRRAAVSGWAAWARGDLDLMLVRYAPDCHVEVLREMVAIGMRNAYQGHAGLREAAADWSEAWERMDLRPQEILDAGETLVILGHFHLRARGSGIEFDSPLGSVMWVKRGLVARERDCADWDEALRMAGIPAPAAGSGQVSGNAALRRQA